MRPNPEFLELQKRRTTVAHIVKVMGALMNPDTERKLLFRHVAAVPGPVRYVRNNRCDVEADW